LRSEVKPKALFALETADREEATEAAPGNDHAGSTAAKDAWAKGGGLVTDGKIGPTARDDSRTPRNGNWLLALPVYMKEEKVAVTVLRRFPIPGEGASNTTCWIISGLIGK
jgi:hypothetical protein